MNPRLHNNSEAQKLSPCCLSSFRKQERKEVPIEVEPGWPEVRVQGLYKLDLTAGTSVTVCFSVSKWPLVTNRHGDAAMCPL